MPDTFRALIAEGDSKQYSVDFKEIPPRLSACRRSSDPGGVFIAELQGRPGDHQARQGHPQIPHGARR